MLVAANAGVFEKIPVENIGDFRTELLQFFAENHSNVFTELESQGVLTDELREIIVEAATEFADDVAVTEQETQEALPSGELPENEAIFVKSE